MNLSGPTRRIVYRDMPMWVFLLSESQFIVSCEKCAFNLFQKEANAKKTEIFKKDVDKSTSE